MFPESIRLRISLVDSKLLKNRAFFGASVFCTEAHLRPAGACRRIVGSLPSRAAIRSPYVRCTSDCDRIAAQQQHAALCQERSFVGRDLAALRRPFRRFRAFIKDETDRLSGVNRGTNISLD